MNGRWSLNPYFLNIYEITHTYKGPLDGIVRYVEKHGNKDDTFFMNHEKISFAFHTNMRRISKIPLTEAPDWIILRKGSPIGSALIKTVENRADIKKKENYYKNYIFDHCCPVKSLMFSLG